MTWHRKVESTCTNNDMRLDCGSWFLIPFANRIDALPCSLDNPDALTVVLIPRTDAHSSCLKKQGLQECRTRRVSLRPFCVSSPIVWSSFSISSKVVKMFDRQIGIYCGISLTLS